MRSWCATSATSALQSGRSRTADSPKLNGGQGKGESDWTYLYDNIREGRELHDSIAVLAAKLIACGTNSGAAVNQLRALMEGSKAPKDERWRTRVREIPGAVDSAVAKYGKQPEPAEPVAAVAEEKPSTSGYTIDNLITVFEKWLILKDHTPIYAMLGAIAANLLPGDPVWLGLIAPPSSAKTELLNSISGLPHVIQAATVTPSGLLSGTPDKQKDKGARGGLLRQIDGFGGFGIICLKDFGSVLSMHAETRAETLAALREVYDGAWTRHLGSAGGKTLSWKGKVAIIFAATEVIDSHHSRDRRHGRSLPAVAPQAGRGPEAIQPRAEACRRQHQPNAQGACGSGDSAVRQAAHGSIPDRRRRDTSDRQSHCLGRPSAWRCGAGLPLA